jgi:PAS domain S-box-containing protein
VTAQLPDIGETGMLALLARTFEHDAVFVVDPVGLVATWNAGGARILGYQAAEIVGRDFACLYVADDVERGLPRRQLEQAAALGSAEDEGWRARRDGSRLWANLVISALRGPGGVLWGYGGVLRDESGRHDAIEHLAESENRFHSMADSAPVLLRVAEPDAHCSFFNRRWLAFTGRPLDSELGQGWAEGVHPDDFASCMSGVLDAFVGQRPFRIEYRLRRADGAYRWLLDEGMPRYLPSGAFTGYVSSCVDITEFREANDALREVAAENARLYQEARAAIGIRDDFLSVASHELRSPLTALTLQLDALLRVHREAEIGQLGGASASGVFGAASGVPDEQAAAAATARSLRKLNAAIRETERLSSLVDGLLEVSRIAAGRLRLRLEPVDLVELLNDVIDRAGPQANAAGCPVALRAPSRLCGRWDRGRLDQVFSNLLGNAFKYAAGTKVSVAITSTDGRACVEVSDQGRGIPAADQGRIFERFVRAVPAHGYGGLGLGLYLTRQIVEAHGGAVGVDSVEGEGSVFRVWLPVESEPRESLGSP